jgi:uncharacterized protein
VTFLVIFGVPIPLIILFLKSVKGKFSDSKEASDTPYPEMRLKRWSWLLEFLGLPVIIVCLFGFSSAENPVGLCFLSLYLYYIFTLFHRLRRVRKVVKRFSAGHDYQQIVEFLRKDRWYWLGVAIVYPIPFVFYFFYHLIRIQTYRNHPRPCKQCQGAMYKLSEKADDEFLSEGQQMEEALGSVNYDVWRCKSCNATERLNYRERYSEYERCPKCKTIAYHSASRRTLENATYSHTGKGEEIHRCEFCGFSKTSIYTISRLERSTTSGSSSSSFGSRSSSSGGSWGGGRSGGGGASSRW